MAAFVVLHLDARGVGHGATVFGAFAAMVVLTRLIAGDLPDRVGPARCAAGGGAGRSASGWRRSRSPRACRSRSRARWRWAPPSRCSTRRSRWSSSNRVPESRRGAALGTFTAFFDAGVGLGAPLAGVAAALGGYPAAFWLASACALGTLSVALALRRGWSGSRAPAPIA